MRARLPFVISRFRFAFLPAAATTRRVATTGVQRRAFFVALSACAAGAFRFTHLRAAAAFTAC